MTEKMFKETQQREWVVKEKAGIEEQLRENEALQSQLGEANELLQQERLKMWDSVPMYCDSYLYILSEANASLKKLLRYAYL